tara:strand:- start:23 stop:1036 length:1014 start_codon:yes stop_codon:yes gene_type:complete
MSTPKAAKTYPDTIFKKTTPDESQALENGPRFNTWYKGWFTRSEIYERMMPDGLTSALRMEGPESGGSAIVMNSKGNIKLITGKRTDVAGSGTLDIKTYGCNQLHNGRTNIQYNPGGTENEGQALNVLAYGDVVEQVIGSTRHIIAKKIEITATEELILNGQVIKIQAQGDIQMAAASINTAQVNKKDIIIGQRMSFGAGEDTDLQFDPRASKNIVSPGNINHKILGKYKLDTIRGMEVNSVLGLDMKALGTTTIIGTKGMVLSGPAGMNLNSGGNLSITATDTDVVAAKLDLTSAATTFTTADLDVNSAAVNITGAADVTITGANVRLVGALIYLN